ncbi:Alpha-galactosidase [Lacticaseibacillus rhamnosus LRHMDP2]|uniref:Alpha-galactosidase n=1 Tax=Lacticaseibacillus rhamnosus LRHMDP3 TaxID=1203259 RepID=A0AB33XY81_LACRH|nr:Alpha-galactosidase [Lacticaseibacillus rhamnosus LRHMDP2]EKS53476.1 Alpha-galactosidase [Lacticaseibacillus rhamnosus LRHMDP3]
MPWAYLRHHHTKNRHIQHASATFKCSKREGLKTSEKVSITFHHNTLAGAGICVKDLGRNGQSPVITLKATYTPVSKRAGSRSLSITRSPAQKPAHKDLGRNDQTRVITPKATYVLSYAHNALPGAEVCV